MDEESPIHLACPLLVSGSSNEPAAALDAPKPEVPEGTTYPRGTIAYGNQGPGTNGSEFFIVHSFANIKPVYTVMGHVTHGMDTLDRIVKAGIVPKPDGTLDGAPKKPVRILHVLAG